MEEKKYTVYIHRVVTDDNGPMYYVGVTRRNITIRWQQARYKATALWPYIEKYGWDNIEHSVFAEDLDRETALRLEDTLILMHRGFGCCINGKRSGLIAKSDINKYARELIRYKRANDPEWAEHDRERQRERRNKNPDIRERNREYCRQWNATPQGKIYTRVHNFNRRHPDRIVETPLEAKRKYLENGYVPDYISHDSL